MGLSSVLGVMGIIFIVIGIIMAIVGIILLIVNQEQMKPWYIWFLLVGGVVIGIIGGIMLAFALAEPKVIGMESSSMKYSPAVRQSYVQQTMQEEPLQLRAVSKPVVETKESKVVTAQMYDPYAQQQVSSETYTRANVPAVVRYPSGDVRSHQGDLTTTYKTYRTEDPGPFSVEMADYGNVARSSANLASYN